MLKFKENAIIDDLDFTDIYVINTWTNKMIIEIQEIKKECPDGWTPDLHFSSQDSFFHKDYELWARTKIRRWV